MMKKIFLILHFLILVSCGKSPLLNKAKLNPIGIIANQEQRFIFSNAQKTFRLNWIIPPSLENLSSVNLEFDDDLENDLALDALIEMRDHGHGSSPIVVTLLNDKKTVELRELSFFMTGRWTLILKLIKNGKVIDSWEQDIYL